MSPAAPVVVSAALPSEASLLENLLELYIHDLSAIFPHVRLGADGRFGYGTLPLYFTQPKVRFPFVIRCEEAVAGFALVTRGSPAVEAADVYDFAEFFVIRGWRRRHVGSAAAFELWRRLPGRWTVRVSEGNEQALEFWERTVESFAPGRVTRFTRPGEPRAWRVLDFESPAPP
jgi:predicted acetyltransferase